MHERELQSFGCSVVFLGDTLLVGEAAAFSVWNFSDIVAYVPGCTDHIATGDGMAVLSGGACDGLSVVDVSMWV